MKVHTAIAALLLSTAWVRAAAADEESRPASRYIVVFHEGVDAEAATARLLGVHGGTADHVYKHALRGFAGPLGAARASAIAADADVKYVEADGVASISRQAVVKGKPGPSTPPAQTTPTGVTRIGAAGKSFTADFAVAVIDTGVDLTHSDLNVENGISYVGTSTANDDNGHGSHVAGTIGAKDNSIGVVGVAPGVRIVAVKVLNRRGSGSYSGVTAGIDWVTGNAAVRKIKVANMSLGGTAGSATEAMEAAVRASIDAGITYAVAAGNETDDAAAHSPARVEEAITVAALKVADGVAAGDSFATFSNYGAVVDIIAPGVSIYSTYKGGSYATLSGTSMASPHVAGAAALVLQANPGYLPADVRQALVVEAATTAVFAVPADTTTKILNVLPF